MGSVDTMIVLGSVTLSCKRHEVGFYVIKRNPITKV